MNPSTTVSVCLTPEAKALRRGLAAWAIGLAAEGEDYTVSSDGSRTYDTARADLLISLLLKEMGLKVSVESQVKESY